MSFAVRPCRADEFDRYLEIDGIVFNYKIDDERRQICHAFFEKDRMLALFDDDVMVGVSANLSLELTLPGGATLPMAGVTWVGVLPTHHRRGGLTMMMKELIEDSRRHNEPIAGLHASESVIYRRFGYGTASRMATTSVEIRRAGLRQPRHRSGSIELIAFEKAGDIAGALIEEYRRTRNGMVSRPDHVIKGAYLFDNLSYPPEMAGKQTHVAIHRDDAGKIDGLVRYAIGDSEGWMPNSEVAVPELWATSTEAELDLWQYLMEMDFSGHVSGHCRPVDETIVDLLADPRRWRMSTRDGLHVRIDDVNRVLGARKYLRDGEVVIEVVDGSGSRSKHRLISDGEGAECSDTEAAPDITLDRATLGSILLGDCSVDRLWRAGLVTEHRPGSVALASAMFLWPQLPWSGYVF
jgi:predicted acetyltransferase